jgi:hypothetical protein
MPVAAALRAAGAVMLALWAAPARADEPPAPSDSTDQSNVSEFRDEVDAARSAWFQGQSEVARDRFQHLFDRLVAGEEIPLELAGEVAIWLGEIRYEFSPDDSRFAEAPWAWLLGRDPDFPISPYQHPADVVGRFEILRGHIKADLAARPPPPKYPLWGYIPFGAPQFGQHEPVRGTVYLIAQLGFTAASIGMYAELVKANFPKGTEWPGEHPLGWPHNKVESWLEERTYLVQWPTTLGFYAVWTASVLDGRSHWHHTYAPEGPKESLGLTVPPIVISGRF